MSKDYDEPRKGIIIKNIPENVNQLRIELSKLENLDIAIQAKQAPTFEMTLATIAMMLDIVVDGMYDADKLCGVLVEAMRNRHRVIIKTQKELVPLPMPVVKKGLMN